MKKTVFILLIILGISEAKAQQDALYSQYMFNPFALNPAYAGSREAISGVLLYRNQWSGFQGAPQTGSFALHSPFKGKNFSLGINGMVETIGPSNNTAIFGTYAYRLKLGKGKLAFGLRGGIYSTKFDKGQLNYNDVSDRFNTGGVFSSTLPSFDFGVYYNTNKFYAGVSSTHLGGPLGNFEDSQNTLFELDQHFIFSTGGAIELSDKVVFKPSGNVKYVANAPINFDVNASFLLNKVFWLGASYRSSKALVLIAEFNITDFLRVGYAYDMDLSLLRSYNGGSHEVFLGFDFSLKKQKSISPRYL